MYSTVYIISQDLGTNFSTELILVQKRRCTKSYENKFRPKISCYTVHAATVQAENLMRPKWVLALEGRNLNGPKWVLEGRNLNGPKWALARVDKQECATPGLVGPRRNFLLT